MALPQKAITIKRTEANDPDFPYLVTQPTLELRELYGDQKVVYDNYNEISQLETVVIGYVNDVPVGCGCFQKANYKIAEIKRVFVKPSERRTGIGSAIMDELEIWAKEEGYNEVVTETAKKLDESISFLKNRGYHSVPKYGPYVDMENSVCFGKKV
ncbi:MAG TPA: GNAT family N-acetyltransferase [Mucilaginibacter sp.]|jgi:GNAT superfamily N-acetyltransferase|nr:GNAT family N-acetyltransferase [Mucilaginibacter sp.]